MGLQALPYGPRFGCSPIEIFAADEGRLRWHGSDEDKLQIVEASLRGPAASSHQLVHR
jgi:hypothetical protein